MFTGIITDVGRVRAIEQRGDTRIVIDTAYDTGTIALGASIACSGACLTVVDKDETGFAVDASAETLACTALGDWMPGRRVNLERALKVHDELGGHIVTGHVDGLATLKNLHDEGDSKRLVLSVPTGLRAFIAPKGSITLDGVSLTVNGVDDHDNATDLGVNIIPHTLSETSLGDAQIGDRLNIEIDILARYVARLRAVES